MTSKTRGQYDLVWAMLKNKKPNLAPSSCIMDFECAAHQSIRAAFESVEVIGCFFHLSQSVWRKTQELGLRNRYINDENVRDRVKMLTALAFVQPFDVADRYDDLEESLEDGLYYRPDFISFLFCLTVVFCDNSTPHL